MNEQSKVKKLQSLPVQDGLIAETHIENAIAYFRQYADNQPVLVITLPTSTTLVSPAK